MRYPNVASGSMPSWAKTLCWRLIPATVSSTSVRMVPWSKPWLRFLDDPAENPPVEGLGDRLALFLGIGQTLQGGENSSRASTISTGTPRARNDSTTAAPSSRASDRFQ